MIYLYGMRDAHIRSHPWPASFVPLYARRAAPSTVFFDMATYFNSRPNGMSMGETLAKLSAMVGGAGRAAAGVGAEMSPGCVVTSCRFASNYFFGLIRSEIMTSRDMTSDWQAITFCCCFCWSEVEIMTSRDVT